MIGHKLWRRARRAWAAPPAKPPLRIDEVIAVTPLGRPSLDQAAHKHPRA